MEPKMGPKKEKLDKRNQGSAECAGSIENPLEVRERKGSLGKRIYLINSNTAHLKSGRIESACSGTAAAPNVFFQKSGMSKIIEVTNQMILGLSWDVLGLFWSLG